MRSSQATLENKVEFCEHSEPIETYFRCKLTDFGFVWRCSLEDKKTCPDLEFFKKQGKVKK